MLRARATIEVWRQSILQLFVVLVLDSLVMVLGKAEGGIISTTISLLIASNLTSFATGTTVARKAMPDEACPAVILLQGRDLPNPRHGCRPRLRYRNGSVTTPIRGNMNAYISRLFLVRAS
jgi:hypothetical protein